MVLTSLAAGVIGDGADASDAVVQTTNGTFGEPVADGSDIATGLAAYHRHRASTHFRLMVVC